MRGFRIKRFYGALKLTQTGREKNIREQEVLLPDMEEVNRKKDLLASL